MNRTRIPSPARSESTVTPRRKYRSTRSVGSPARSNTSGRLTSIIDQFKKDNWESIIPSPLNKTVLTDDTEIEQPRRQSWWKKVNQSRDISEVLGVEKTMEPFNILDDLEMEVLSQGKNNFSVDLPDSSGSESIGSIVIPQKKLFTQKENFPQDMFKQILDSRKRQGKNNISVDLPDSSGSESIGSIVIPQRKLFKQKEKFPQDMFKQILDSRKSMTLQNNTNIEDKTVNIGTKTLFGRGTKRSRPAFPAGLLTVSPDKTLNIKTKQVPTEVKTQPRSLFGHRQGTKQNYVLADFIASESEDEISEIQPKLFAFQKNTNPVRHSIASRRSRSNREPSPASSLTTDIEMDDWKMLPSSTMVEHHFDALGSSTHGKKIRLSKLSEAKESEAGTKSNNTINKTKSSNKSSSKNKSKITPELTAKELELDNSTISKSAEKEDKIETSSKEQDLQTNKSKANSSEIINRFKKATEHEDMIDANGTANKLINKTQVFNKTGKINLPIIDEKSREVTDLQSEANSHVLNNQTYKITNDSDVTLQRRNQNLDDENQGEKEKSISSQKEEQMENKTELQVVAQVETEEEEQVKAEKEAQVEAEEEMPLDAQEEVQIEAEKELQDEAEEEMQVEAEEEAQVEAEKEAQIEAEEDVQGDAEMLHIESENEEPVEVEDKEKLEVEDEEKLEAEDKEHVVADDDVHVEAEEEQAVVEDLDVQADNEVQLEAENEEQVEAEDEVLDKADVELHYESDEVVEAEDEVQVRAAEHVEAEDEVLGEGESELHFESEDEVHSEAENEEPLEAEDEEQVETEEEEQVETDGEEQVADEAEEQVDADEEVQVQVEEDDEVEIREHEQDQDEGDEQVDDTEMEVDDDADDQNQNEMVEVSEEEPQNDSDLENEEEDQNEDDFDEDIDQESEIEESEENIQAEVQESEQEEAGEIDAAQESSESDTETANVTHDTIGRHRQKDVQSPEDILHNISNHAVSIIAKGRNTSIRKTLLKNFTVRQSEVPLRESTRLDDGSKDSSAEGSGWDSHRTTRKTLRQTFGKDFTPRKSLRVLVMEKSAKRQTAINEANAKLHQANSTEIPEHSAPEISVAFDNDEILESDHEISKRTRQTTLEVYLQKVNEEIMDIRRKVHAEIDERLAKNEPSQIKFTKPLAIQGYTHKKHKTCSLKAPKAKRTKVNIIPLEHLPEDFLNDLNYKPPKRYKPRNASWVTKRLYKFLETKLAAKYDYKARLRAEKLVETIYEFTRQISKQRVAPPHAVDELKHELARLNVVNTHYEFYDFIREYLPFEVKIKVVPDIVNNIPLPKDVFSAIIA